VYKSSFNLFLTFDH